MTIQELETLAEKSQLEFFFSNGRLHVQREPPIFANGKPKR
ncbi:MAG: hypothetical protein ABIK73_07285 [candidate division WOR-3 bacterium]